MSGQSRFITANGLQLHYLDFGNPSQPPLGCIHGLSGNAHNFDGLAPHLMNDYHVISIDVRGRGDSDGYSRRRERYSGARDGRTNVSRAARY